MSCPELGNLSYLSICLATQTDPSNSLEELRLWIAKESAIDVGYQILMTARGKQVKLQNLHNEVRPPSTSDRCRI